MKKKCVSICLALLLALLPVMFACADTTYYVTTGNHKSLNMRADTDTNSTIITTIPYGAEVGFIGVCDNPSWAAVYYGNNNGYVMMRYLTKTKPSPGSGSGSSTTGTLSFKSFKSADYYATVKPSTPTGHVNMRWAPSTDTAIHAKYQQGDVLRVISETKAWAQVLDESTMTCGFMLKNFLNY